MTDEQWAKIANEARKDALEGAVEAMEDLAIGWRVGEGKNEMGAVALSSAIRLIKKEIERLERLIV